MKIPIVSVAAALALAPASPLLAKGPVATPTPEKTSVVWQEDPLCQFVFFAVLEGLYRDGVQNEVVDAILAADVKSLDAKVKHSFVFKCELCHAVYEAFNLYRARPAFANTEGKVSFGKGVDLKILKDLEGDKVRNRVYAMGSLIRPWIQHRVEATRMTDAEKETMKAKFKEYAEEGNDLLSKLRRESDSVYIDWNFYGTCQACEASKDFK